MVSSDDNEGPNAGRMRDPYFRRKYEGDEPIIDVDEPIIDVDEPIIDQDDTITHHTNQFKFDGKEKELFNIFINNLLLTLATFGVYYFWAKVKIRKYFYQHTEFIKERFDYHATGEELFKGFLRFLLIILPIVAALLSVIYLLLGNVIGLEGVLSFWLIVIFIALFITGPYIIPRSYRFRASRSTYRNIRFRFTGTTKELIPIFVSGGFFILITLGIYLPWFIVDVRKYIWNNMKYGNQSFRYTGSGTGLWKIYFLVGIIATVGDLVISAITYEDPTVQADVSYWGLFWYTSLYLFVWSYLTTEVTRFNWVNTFIRSLKFNSDIKFRNVFVIYLVGLVLTVITLGLAYPWFIIMKRRLLIRTTYLVGTPDFAEIEGAVAGDESALGDDMGDDIDFGTGIFD